MRFIRKGAEPLVLAELRREVARIEQLHCDRHRTPYAPGPPERGLLHVMPCRRAPEPAVVFAVNVTAPATASGR